MAVASRRYSRRFLRKRAMCLFVYSLFYEDVGRMLLDFSRDGARNERILDIIGYTMVTFARDHTYIYEVMITALTQKVVAPDATAMLLAT